MNFKRGWFDTRKVPQLEKMELDQLATSHEVIDDIDFTCILKGHSVASSAAGNSISKKRGKFMGKRKTASLKLTTSTPSRRMDPDTSLHAQNVS